MVYISLIAWLLLCANFTLHKNNDFLKMGCPKKSFLVLFFAACALVMGLRASSVGVDTPAYMRHFDEFSAMSFWEIIISYNPKFSQELGYSFLMKLASCLINNYYFFQLVVSVIYCFGMAKFIYDNTNDVFMGTVCFLGIGLYFQAFNTAQQLFAAMFAINGWTYLRKQNIKGAVIAMVLACVMHSSGVFFLAAYLVYYLAKNRKLLIWLPALILLVALNYQWVLKVAVYFFPMYERYLNGDYGVSDVGAVFVMWMIIAVLSLFVIYGKHLTDRLTYRKWFKNYTAREMDYTQTQKGIAILCLIYVTTCLVGMSFNYFERIGLYFMPFSLILFDMVPPALPNQRIEKVYRVGVCVCFLSFFLLTGLTAVQYDYTFFFMMQ